MAVISSSVLAANGIDLDVIKKSIGPRKVENRKDGTVAIENHSLDDLIKLMKFLRGTNRTSKGLLAKMHSAQIRMGDATGGYKGA